MPTYMKEATDRGEDWGQDGGKGEDLRQEEETRTLSGT